MSEMIRQDETVSIKRRIDLYWKVEFLRRWLSKSRVYYWAYTHGDFNWLGQFLWNFLNGYSVLDSLYYNIYSPSWLKRLARKLSVRIHI